MILPVFWGGKITKSVKLETNLLVSDAKRGQYEFQKEKYIQQLSSIKFHSVTTCFFTVNRTKFYVSN